MVDSKNKDTILARELISLVGGKDNIEKVIHCVTRLRFYLKDPQKPVDSQIENLDDVMGVSRGSGQFQVIIGPGVDTVYKEIMAELALQQTDAPMQNSELTSDMTIYERTKHHFNQLLGIITGSIMPVISILAAAGVIKSILTLLTVTTNVISTTSSAYIIINAMADAVFYFLPIMIAFNAAQQMKGNPLMTAVVAGVIIHPTIIEAANESLNILTVGSLNFPFISYTYSIFPMIIAAWLIKVIEPRLKAWSPRMLQSLIVPIVTISFVSGLTLVVVGPIIMWLSQGLATGLDFLLNLNAPIFSALIAGFYQLLVIFGLHWGIIPIYVNDFALHGESQLSAVVSILAVAQGGAALAVAMKSKKTNIKEIGYAGSLSAFAGITEPAMFGINLRFRYPFLIASIASAVGGFIMGFFRVTMWNIMGSIIGLPSFIDPQNGITANFWYALLATMVTLMLSFVLTYFWGYDDKMSMQEKRIKPTKPYEK